MLRPLSGRESSCPSSLKATRAQGKRETVFLQRLCNVNTQHGGDLRERTVQATRQAGHTCRGCKGNQRYDQEILNQTLPCFIFMQASQAIYKCLPHFLGSLVT